MCRLAGLCNRNDMKATLDELKSAKLDLESDEIRSLRGMIFDTCHLFVKLVVSFTIAQVKNLAFG